MRRKGDLHFRGGLVIVTVVCALFIAVGCGGDATTTVDETTTATTTSVQTTTTTTTTTTSAPTGDGVHASRRCGDVPFAPQTDAGAFDIHATGTSCETARAVARAADNAARDSYSARGFRCEGGEPQGELPSVEYTCTKEDARITFVVS